MISYIPSSPGPLGTAALQGEMKPILYRLMIYGSFAIMSAG